MTVCKCLKSQITCYKTVCTGHKPHVKKTRIYIFLVACRQLMFSRVTVFFSQITYLCTDSKSHMPHCIVILDTFCAQLSNHMLMCSGFAYLSGEVTGYSLISTGFKHICWSHKSSEIGIRVYSIYYKSRCRMHISLLGRTHWQQSISNLQFLVEKI